MITAICLTCFRQTQWDPPSWDSVGADDAMDLESPLYEEIVKVRDHILKKTLRTDS